MLETIKVPTPHINAPKGAFAKTVLMPGDPKRAQYIAEKYLQNAKLVNDVRGMKGYTGEYKGKKVSVMSHGIGIPSASIYTYELFHGYDVENIIRIGSAGGLLKEMKLKDIILATGSCTDSNCAKRFNLNGTVTAAPSFELMLKAYQAIERLNFKDKVKYGLLLSNDNFYKGGIDTFEWTKVGVIGVEMESYAIFLNAANAGKRALCFCTVSDQMVTGESLTSEERVKFDDMILLALETAFNID